MRTTRKLFIACTTLGLLSCGTLAPAQTQYFTGTDGVPQGWSTQSGGITTVYDARGIPMQIQSEYRSPSEGMWDYKPQQQLQPTYITTPQNLRQQELSSQRGLR